MSEDKFVKNMLNYQENLDSVAEARKVFLEGHDLIFQSVMNSVDSKKRKIKIKEAYEEFLKVEAEVFGEKGDAATIDDIKKIIPENYWIELAESGINPDDSKVDFDKIWKGVTEKLDWDEIKRNALDEELKEAKKKGQIN